MFHQRCDVVWSGLMQRAVHSYQVRTFLDFGDSNEGGVETPLGSFRDQPPAAACRHTDDDRCARLCQHFSASFKRNLSSQYPPLCTPLPRPWCEPFDRAPYVPADRADGFKPRRQCRPLSQAGCSEFASESHLRTSRLRGFRSPSCVPTGIRNQEFPRGFYSGMGHVRSGSGTPGSRNSRGGYPGSGTSQYAWGAVVTVL